MAGTLVYRVNLINKGYCTPHIPLRPSKLDFINIEKREEKRKEKQFIYWWDILIICLEILWKIVGNFSDIFGKFVRNLFCVTLV